MKAAKKPHKLGGYSGWLSNAAAAPGYHAEAVMQPLRLAKKHKENHLR